MEPATMLDDFRMLIDGDLVSAAQTIDVINPATGAVFARAPDASAADLDRAVAAARAAFPAWRALPIADRRALLIEGASRIDAAAEALAALFTREQGRPLAFALEEIRGAAYWLRETAALDLPVEVIEDSKTRRIEVHHEPIGVVAALVPWNFPVSIAIWKTGAPLLAGNTLVLKPSPYTPLATLKIAELLANLFPAGVFNVLSGGDGLGPMMTDHPGFAKISFTGSTATGRKVMGAAARDLKRVTLELGGNDPAIILPDVDVDAVAQGIFFGAFFNSAQICAATKRLYVHDDIYDALRDRLHELALNAPLGDGAQPGVMFGPIQNAAQFGRVRALIDDARDQGLTLLEGAPPPEGNGYFVPLTIVDNPPEKSRVVVEEAFGPVLPMLRFHDVDDVIARANDTEYGLTACVWSSDVNAAVAVGMRLEVGTVWINQNLTVTPMTPTGGIKQSGMGVENGLAGLLEQTQSRAIYIPKTAVG